MSYRRRCSGWIATIAFALAISGGAIAQSELDQDGVRLTLREALQTALENNLELVSARIDPEIAAEQIIVQEAALDGSLGADVTYTESSEDQTITSNISPDVFPGTNDTETLSGGVTWTDPLSFGGSYSVGFRPIDQSSVSSQIDRNTGLFRDNVSDFTQGELTLSYEMPLLRGFGRQVTQEPILLARTDAEISVDAMKSQAILVIESVENAYWDVVANHQALSTAMLALDRAENLLTLNEKKVQVGTLAPIEITQAEAGVASRQEDVIVAEVNLRNSEDELRRLLGLPANHPAWSEAILATDRPSSEKRFIDLDRAIDTALANRPEVVNARREESKNALSAGVARKNTLHQLDFRAEYKPRDREIIQGNEFPAAPSQNNNTTTDSDGTDWELSLTYTLPLRNRLAKANRRIAALTLEKAQVDLVDVEQTVRVEVRTAVRNVDSGHKRVLAAQKNVELQDEKLRAEEKKFENGMSTSFEVLTFQNDLADAQLSLIQARLDYAKALTAVERVKGTLLEARDLEIR